jgi:hypothetical protein
MASTSIADGKRALMRRYAELAPDRFEKLPEELRMAKTKGGLFSDMEDDLKQFWAAMSGTLRVAAGAIAKRVGLATPSANDDPAHPKRLGSGEESSAEVRQADP